MGHFHNPPIGPIVGAVAGRQPYGPKQLPPSITAVPVNNPPFVTANRTKDTRIEVSSWQPDPWQYNYSGPAGGLQPYSPRLLPPSITAVPVNNPPFVHEGRQIWEGVVVQAWQPDPWSYGTETGAAAGRQPYGPRQLPPAITAVPVNNPPFSHPGRFGVQLQELGAMAWQPPDPSPIISFTGGQPLAPSKLPPSITAVPVNNPPFTDQEENVSNIATKTAWQPDPWQYNYVGATYGLQPYGYRSLNPSITAVPVNNPPFSNQGSDAVNLSTVQAWWQPPDPPIQSPRYYPQAPVVVVTAVVPFNNLWLVGVLNSWQPPDPLPTLPRNLPPFVTSVPVNNPPGKPYPSIFVIDDQPLPTLPRNLNPAITAVPVNNPPFNQTGVPTPGLAQWQPPDPSPFISYTGWQPLAPNKLPPAITAVPVNNPPFNQRIEPLPGLAAWQIPDPPIQPPRYYPQPFVVVTTVVPFNNVWLAGVLSSWQLPDPSPTLQGKLNPSITAVPVNNPPFNQRSELSNVTQQWQPNPWQYNYVGWTTGLQPYGAKQLNPSITAVPVNNPPFNQRVEPLPGLAAWQVPDPLIQPPRYYPQAPVVVVTYVPFNQTWLASVVSAWQPPDPPPTLARNLSPGIPGMSVDNPPFGLLVTVIEPWIQDPNLPVLPRNLNPAFTSVTVNNPPFSYAGRQAFLANVIYSWQPPDPPPVQRGPLAPAITAVPVNNPPFRNFSRTAAFESIMIVWEIPPPPQPQQKPPSYIVNILPPVVTRTFSYISASYIQ